MNTDDVMVVTTHSVEGFHITKYFGTVFGETIYKGSFGKQINAAIGNFVRSFAFSAQEMAESVAMLESAREYALEKLRANARVLGANAVLGMATNNSIGMEGVTYLQLYGTAVIIESDEQLLQQKKEAIRKQEIAEENERKMKVLKQAITAGESGNGCLSAFVTACQGVESATEIKQLWQNAGLSELKEYEILTARLDSLVNLERFYGKNGKSVRDFITSIQNML